MDSLEPEIVAFLEQRHGTGATATMRREPISPAESLAVASVERVTLSGTLEGPARYVVKRLRPRGDWIGRATNDERMREQQLLAAGIYRALPQDMGAAVVSGVRLADGAALIMHDVADALVPDHAPLTSEQLEQALQALARLHTAFYGFPARLMAGLGLCTIGQWLTLYAPSTVTRADVAAPDRLAARIVDGWARLAEFAPEAWEVLQPLLTDPTPLIRALRECPDTFVHGDVRMAHVAFAGDRVVLLDWGQTLRAPGALDLGWYLAVNASRLPVEREAAIEIYRVERQRLGRLPATGDPWERELALARLAGAMRSGWALVRAAIGDDEAAGTRLRREMHHWTDQVLTARRWLP